VDQFRRVSGRDDRGGVPCHSARVRLRDRDEANIDIESRAAIRVRRAGPRPAAELTEIGRLFRAKVQQLHQRETRSVAQSYKLRIAARRRSKLNAIDTPPSDHELLSTTELAGLLNVHPKTVLLWAADGELPLFRTLGGHRRYRRGDPTRWLNRARDASP
jgi:excisionase family DNA binding protein